MIITPFAFMAEQAGEVNPVADFLTATGITDTTISSSLVTLYDDCVSDGTWDKFLALYPLVGSTADEHKYNLVDTTQYTLTYSDIAHSSNGIKASTTTGYANTGITMFNNGLEGYYETGSWGGFWRGGGGTQAQMGARGADDLGTTIRNNAFTFGGTQYFDLYADNGSDGRITTSNANTGSFAVRANGSGGSYNAKVYLNGSFLVQDSSITQANRDGGLDAPFLLCNRQVGSTIAYSNYTLRTGWIAGNLTDTDTANISLRIKEFNENLGRSVITS